MRRSTDRFLTTHTGSLPRPSDLQDLLRRQEQGDLVDPTRLRDRANGAIRDIVGQQIEAGLDVVSDGEQSKANFFSYVRERLDGIQGSTTSHAMDSSPDFPGFQAWWAANHQSEATGLRVWPECVGPLAWKDRASLEADIETLKKAADEGGAAEAFMPSASVGLIAQRIPNRYYGTYEEYVEAIANAMSEEYRAITDAGLILQIDAPEMCIDRGQPPFRGRPVGEFRKLTQLWIEALNHALAGIDEDKVRFHICWGNGERPHSEDVPLVDIIDQVFEVRAGAYSIEAANPRHAHEWKLWEELKLPEGRVLIPGVIDSTTNFVEHEDLVAQRIVTYANLLGRENVIAGTDCGFGTTAFAGKVYPPVVWAKLRSLVEGARRASEATWSWSIGLK